MSAVFWRRGGVSTNGEGALGVFSEACLLGSATDGPWRYSIRKTCSANHSVRVVVNSVCVSEGAGKGGNESDQNVELRKAILVGHSTHLYAMNVV